MHISIYPIPSYPIPSHPIIYQLSAINYQLSTIINYQLSTIPSYLFSTMQLSISTLSQFQAYERAKEVAEAEEAAAAAEAAADGGKIQRFMGNHMTYA